MVVPVTQKPEADSPDSKSTKVSAVLDTVAVLVVWGTLLGMILALSTVLQAGFD